MSDDFSSKYLELLGHELTVTPIEVERILEARLINEDNFIPDLTKQTPIQSDQVGEDNNAKQ